VSTPADTFTDRTGATDEEFRARVAVFDAAEEPEEVVVERVARAILHAVLGDTDGGLVLDGDLPASEIARLIHEVAAPAALTALRGDRG
jgi:hypothetical protein